MESSRELARRYLQAALHPTESDEADGSKHTRVDEQHVIDEAAKLSPADRGLFQELSRGCLREWHFLEWVVHQFAKRAPSEKTKGILAISAYQLLFLNRIPDYAVYSEAKHMGEALHLTDPEHKFIHGVLKSIEREKQSLLDAYAASLEKLTKGELATERKPQDVDWAVINAPPLLVDALTLPATISADSASKPNKEARKRAVRALAAMKKRSRLVGFALPGQKAPAHEVLGSEIAPSAVVFEPGEEFQQAISSGAAWVQGEASQWVCEMAAKELAARAGVAPMVRVLEMATGRGGKIVGTLAAWTRQLGGDPEKIPAVQWIAADSSQEQLDLLEKNVLPLIQKIWPQVSVDVRRWTWDQPLPKEELNEKELGPIQFIWLDAPCTGFGTLGKLPQIALKRGTHAYDEALKLSKTQQRLSAVALKMLSSQAAFLYTVCTLTKPETIDVTAFVGEQSKRKPKLEKALWPGSAPAVDAEGFYAALF